MAEPMSDARLAEIENLILSGPSPPYARELVREVRRLAQVADTLREFMNGDIEAQADEALRSRGLSDG